MRQNLVPTLIWLLLATIAHPLAANPSAEFYLNLQRRGVSAFEAARYQEAVDQLRIAAFGMVDDLPLYSQTQVYLTIAYDQLTQQDRARDAARRVLAAERISRSYARIMLSDPLRNSFEGLAARLLTPAEFGYLTEPVRRTTTPATPSGTTDTLSQTRSEQRAAPAPRQPAPVTRQAAATQPPPAASAAPAEKSAAPSPATTTAPDSSRAKESTSSTPPPSSTVAQPRATAPVPPATTPPPAPPPAQPSRVEMAPRDATSAPPAVNVAAELQTAEQFLTAADLAAARKIFRQLLAHPTLTHREGLRLAEGLYRSRDFEGTLAAFERIGELRPGEEPYRYYVAVASYETGRYSEARRALTQALPYIQITSDVVRYRSLIEAAAN
jgi:tetratricopeptide (TPR) repeat protein